MEIFYNDSATMMDNNQINFLSNGEVISTIVTNSTTINMTLYYGGNMEYNDSLIIVKMMKY